MSYTAHEATPHSGNPVELFLFTIEGVPHRFVHYDEDVVVDGYTWTAAYIKRPRFVRGEGNSKAEITLTTSLEFPFLSVFASGIPDSPIYLTIYRLHLSDASLETRIVWSGQVLSRTCTASEVTFSCAVPEIELGSMGLRRRYQTTCPWPLYSPFGCKVNRENHKVERPILSISQNGLILGVAVGAAARFGGGYLIKTTLSHTYRTYITKGRTDQLILQRPVAWLAVDDVVAIYPGCDKTTKTCQEVFFNLDNNGSFPTLPSVNLFSTQAF